MEAVEFYIMNGKTCFMGKDGVGRQLTPQNRDEITFMLENIGKVFPDAMKALKEWAKDSERNRVWFEFRIVDRFVRCNFGDDEFLHTDVDDMGMFHLEEVKCPLRGSGYCKHENVVCKPKASLGLSEEESKVVGLYAQGMRPGEIAARLGKAEQTCKQQINHAYKRLKLPHPRWLIKLFNAYSITM